LLTRDTRIVERKKAGLKKARKRPQFSKRWGCSFVVTVFFSVPSFTVQKALLCHMLCKFCNGRRISVIVDPWKQFSWNHSPKWVQLTVSWYCADRSELRRVFVEHYKPLFRVKIVSLFVHHFFLSESWNTVSLGSWSACDCSHASVVSLWLNKNMWGQTWTKQEWLPANPLHSSD
jgi:hypothetical protein